MNTESAIEERIDTAAEAVGPAWPLHSFVTANPLAGFEDRPFHEAVADGERMFGGDGYPEPAVFGRAWESGRIDPEILRDELAANGYDGDADATLERMADGSSSGPASSSTAATNRVDAVLTKWLSAFLDQGRAEWTMPNHEEGFYAAFRAVAPHDSDIAPVDATTDLPEDPVDALHAVVAEWPTGRWADVFEFHLSALPGWSGFVKQQAAGGGAWQSAHPVTLHEYLAVRLTLVDLFDAPVFPAEAPDCGGAHGGPEGDQLPLPAVWLAAWEATYRSELVGAITDASESLAGSDGDRPDAQLVFCIDTRSEILRRHVEAAGDYETHGYAGFFGVPIRYDGYGSDVTVDARPPILDAEHRVEDRSTAARAATRDSYDRWQAAAAAGTRALERLKSNAATAFSFVESTGVGYGAALAARTLLPRRVRGLVARAGARVPDPHEFCEPTVEHDPDPAHDLPVGFTLEERVEYAAAAVELMGWEQFARVVAFVGHASETTNNPFDASLDCGACAGNPGGPSARVLAAICNDPAVRAGLEDRGIDVPEDTVFVAGEHNTTTDEVVVYDGGVPATHATDLERLREDLATAREGAATERAADMGAEAGAGVRETERRAADWAETRPEWGLAGNAGFVVGPRALTDGLDLDGRAFLHSYDWQTDPDGEALEAILTGPLVVTQWINAQYYFATVDTAVYGSGSKVTQNPVGNVGVYQGTGGDLATGLPLESVAGAGGEPYHQPLRLSAVVHAPVERVTRILSEHRDVATLLDNGWLSLTVVDPQRNHRAFQYDGGLEWTPFDGEPAEDPSSATTPAVADD